MFSSLRRWSGIECILKMLRQRFEFLNFKFSISQNFLNWVFGRNWLAEAGPDVELTRLQVIIQPFFCHVLIFGNSISTILFAACNRQRVSIDFNWYVHCR